MSKYLQAQRVRVRACNSLAGHNGLHAARLTCVGVQCITVHVHAHEYTLRQFTRRRQWQIVADRRRRERRLQEVVNVGCHPRQWSDRAKSVGDKWARTRRPLTIDSDNRKSSQRSSR